MPEEPEVFKKLAEAEAAPDLSVPFTGSYEMNQQIIEHTLTIPSWSSSIDRVRKQTDLSIISAHAREGLAKQLQSLIDHVSDLLGAIKED